tara:strand:- start:7764 stop:7943 length:180 start_codon:yes stop_codon:yes gene_type:complete
MKNLNYLLIVLGAAVAIYSESNVEESEYFLIGGIVILMIGIYRISKNIPSRNQDNEEGL